MAGDCSYKYLLDETQNTNTSEKDFYLVTVSVDRVDFMQRLSANRDLKMSSFMLMAKGSTLMVKIDVLQRDAGSQDWQQVGDALIVFVARDAKSHKAYQIPEMKASKFDNLEAARKCFEIGLTIKDWSKDKSLRDLHHKIPDLGESEHYQEYLKKVEELAKSDPDCVVTTRNTQK